MDAYAKGDYRALSYKFIYSHDANVDVSVEINRLELPLAAHPDGTCALQTPPKPAFLPRLPTATKTLERYESCIVLYLYLLSFFSCSPFPPTKTQQNAPSPLHKTATPPSTFSDDTKPKKEEKKAKKSC